MLNNRASKIGAFLLALFFVLTYLFPINDRLLWHPDETRYAEISREMVTQGDWVVPKLLDLRYFEKPVAGYWVNNVSQLVFGHTNFAVRAGSVFSILISTLLVYWMTLLMWRNRHTAFVASLVFVSMFLVFSVGTYSVLDPMFAMWVIASMAFSFRALKAENVKTRITSWCLLGLACGMGFMTKGFLALAIPVVAMLPVMLYQRRFLELLKFGPLAVFCAVLISLPWAIAVHQQEPDYWRYFIVVEHFQRFSGEDAQHASPVWYYIPVILLGCLPWLALLPGALFKGWKERRNNPPMFFLFCWFVAPFLLFSIAKGKLPTYMLPLMAPLAVMIAKYGVDCVRKHRMKALQANGILNLTFGAVAVAGLIVASYLVKKPIYQPDEWSKVVLGIVAFTIWGIIGYLCYLLKAKHWLWAASCSLVISLTFGSAVPDRSVDSKLPQAFIRQNMADLEKSPFIVSNSVGIGAGLAWELKRGDIYLLNNSGELTYGLKYLDSEYRLLNDATFADWLAETRKKGQVALLVTDKNDTYDAKLPPADKRTENSRMTLYIYDKQP